MYSNFLFSDLTACERVHIIIIKREGWTFLVALSRLAEGPLKLDTFLVKIRLAPKVKRETRVHRVQGMLEQHVHRHWILQDCDPTAMELSAESQYEYSSNSHGTENASSTVHTQNSHSTDTVYDPSASSTTASSRAQMGHHVRKTSGKRTVVQMLMDSNVMYRGQQQDSPVLTKVADFLAPSVHYLMEKGVFFRYPPDLSASHQQVLWVGTQHISPCSSHNMYSLVSWQELHAQGKRCQPRCVCWWTRGGQCESSSRRSRCQGSSKSSSIAT